MHDMSVSPITQAIILAAGSGSRLEAASAGVPKPLAPIAGRPLIVHALAHAQASGCTEAVVVIGYQGAQVRAAVEALGVGLSVRFVDVADASLPNGVSLLATEQVAAPQFFLQMVDHVFTAPALSRLVTTPLGSDEGGRLLIDRAPAVDLDDATKVRVQGGRIAAIGKGLEPWDAVDMGLFVLTAAVYDALRRVPAAEPLSVTAGMRQLIAQRLLGAVDATGVQWADVDTAADREAAERLLSACGDAIPLAV
jgi:choline kinase